MKLPGAAEIARQPQISIAIEDPPATASMPAAPVAAPVAPPARRAAPRASAEPAPGAIKPPTPVRAPIKTQDVYALIENTLIHTASDNDCEPFQGSQPGALAPERPAPFPAPRARKSRKARAATWPEEFKAEPIAEPPAAPPEAPPPRRRPKPKRIGRWTAWLTRWWGSPGQED